MAARAMWKGRIRFGDVDVPVKLYSAVQDQAVHFRLLDAKRKEPIKQQMVDRFGKEVLQVPEQSTLYPILAVAGVVLLAAFGFGFWTITRRGDKPAAEAATIDPEVEARIARELKELD